MSIVTKQDIIEALERLRIEAGDIVLVHSSLKSMGYVEGGAEAVIEAFLDILTLEGTLVMPTLVQKDFANAYKTWDINKPSDTGYITEVFRKYPGSIRSDQATHPVSAKGKMVVYLTEGHTDFGERYGVFGDTPFSVSSPWQKLYDLNAKVVMVGVSLTYNTLKHLIEYILVDERLKSITDPKKREEEKSKLRHHSKPYEEGQIWPSFNGPQHQEAIDKAGLLKSTSCGNATFYTYRAGDTGNLIYSLAKENPEEWFSLEATRWLTGDDIE